MPMPGRIRGGRPLPFVATVLSFGNPLRCLARPDGSPPLPCPLAASRATARNFVEQLVDAGGPGALDAIPASQRPWEQQTAVDWLIYEHRETVMARAVREARRVTIGSAAGRALPIAPTPDVPWLQGQVPGWSLGGGGGGESSERPPAAARGGRGGGEAEAPKPRGRGGRERRLRGRASGHPPGAYRAGHHRGHKHRFHAGSCPGELVL